MPLLCCELVRRGRYVVAEPYFEGGAIISLADGKRLVGREGSLAIIAAAGAMGRTIEVLGSEDNIDSVMRGLLAERGALGEVPAPGDDLGAPSRAEQSEIDELSDAIPFASQREDLTSQLCVTIDPPGAKDHDDAIGIERCDDGGCVIWIHIADVSAYVRSGSELDRGALDRAMSVYVPGTVAPMLPERLSSDLCSLVPGVTRGCVSIRVELDAAGAVADTSCARTLIRSARRLTYDQVDSVLAGGTIDPVIDGMLRDLDRITSVLHARRIKRGALEISLGETRWKLQDGRVVGGVVEHESASHRVVEECMLLANEYVGQRLADAKRPGIWRVHDHPEPEGVVSLVQQLELLGVPTPPIPDSFSGAEAARIVADIARAVQQFSSARGRGRLAFAPRVLRALQQARYDAKPGVHSGLAAARYAHFTSPIRRYPDLVNHRSLLALMGLTEEPECPVDLDVVAEHVTFVERALIDVERRADDIVSAHLLHRRMYVDADRSSAEHGQWSGEVVGLIKSGAFVRFGGLFRGFLPARTLSPDERYELDDDGLALVAARSGYRIRLGDTVDVYPSKITRANGRVDVLRVGTADEGRTPRRPGRTKPTSNRGGAHRRRRR